MLCYQCGADLGDGLGLCPSCRSNRGSKQQRMQSAREHLHSAQPAVATFFASGFVVATILVLVYLLMFVLLGVHSPKAPIEKTALLAACYSLGLVSVCAYAQMWIEVGFDDPIVLLMSLIVPVSTYRVVMSNPERMWKPFIVHTLTAVGAVALFFLTNSNI